MPKRPSTKLSPKPCPECWRPIPDFPGYEVSDHGRARSYWAYGAGDHYNWHIADRPQRLLRPGYKDGYAHITLRTEHRRGKFRLHRLVLLAFAGPCPKGMVSRHLDGNRKNNHIGNLRWGTYSENMQDSLEHGTHVSGSFATRKLTPQRARQIRKEYATGTISTRALAKKWGVSKSGIHCLCSGQSYQDCPGPVFLVEPHNRRLPNVQAP